MRMTVPEGVLQLRQADKRHKGRIVVRDDGRKMGNQPELLQSNAMNIADSTDAIAARVAREKSAHEDAHIDEALRKWWATFPHVFTNPSMKGLGAFFASELGSVRDKTVLEYGCGQGDFAIWLLDQGARVFGIDISEFNIQLCEEKAKATEIDPSRYTFAVMNAHETTFPDEFFDRVVGNGILHHLDLAAAMAEVDRILKPDGRALFQEPLGDNPLLKFYRTIARIHTPDERPLTRGDLIYLTKSWNMKAKFSGLVTLPFSVITSIILRPYPSNWVLRVASEAEGRLNDHHILEHWNRFAVLVYDRETN
jgi:2-polyprenyl-3-methyl-5-hydroxy-6-metoxy-1,4-benzoquinol methylase